MAAAALTGKGQIVIPAEIRARYGLTPGTRVEFVDDGGSIRLVERWVSSKECTRLITLNRDLCGARDG